VTATRKRPQAFDQLVGQDFVVSTLKSSLKLERIAHAYIFSGPRGVGKTSAARILAKALNCENGPTAEPCGECSQCQEIARGNSLDVIEIDGASNTSVNDIRELKDEVLFAPSNGRYKVYIIDEVHMLSNSAFNALLKTIEEPPPYIVFIFATTEIHKVPATIRSRCQQFNFRLISVESIRDQLRQVAEEMNITAEDEALFWIAKEATGSLRDAYTLFDQIASFSESTITLGGIQEKLGLAGIDAVGELVEMLAAGSTGAAVEKAELIISQGVSTEQLLIDLTEYFRTLLLLKNGIQRESLLGYHPDHFSPEIRGAFSASQLEYAVEQLLAVYRDIRYSLNQRFELELTLSKLSSLKSHLNTGELVARIQELRSELVSSSGGGGTGTGNTRNDSAGPRSAPGAAFHQSQHAEGRGPDQGAQKKSPESHAAPEPAAVLEIQATSELQTTHEPEIESGPEAVSVPSDVQPAVPAAPAAPDSSTTAVPAAETDWRRLTEDEIQSMIDEVRQYPTLVSTLQKVTDWDLQKNTLTLSCDTNYSRSKLKKDIATLRSAAVKVLNTSLEIKLAVKDNGDPENGEDSRSRRDEQADLVRKVFRGKIVDGAEYESNGPF
ncbi:MAG: DNA polymerase III subunit gamma/tau, partial [Sediminispirochaetaceae bacterium]